MACSDTDYAYLRELVLAAVGEPDRAFAQRAVRDAAEADCAAGGRVDGGGFCELLRVDRKPHLHRAVAEAMTMNETSFFRDRRHLRRCGRPSCRAD